MTHKKLLSPIQNIVLFNSIIKLSGVFKLSFIVGSHIAFFSAVAICAPLSGAFAGIAGSLGVFGVSIALRALLMGSMPIHFLAYHIPGLFASLHWATQSRLARIAPAFMCMVLFIAHPVGSSAALYSLFWLIPVFTTLYARQNALSRAFGSTFTAHAVGSVIWLYTVPMSADHWLSLIPVVILERALFAVGMVAAYKAISWAFAKSVVRSEKIA